MRLNIRSNRQAGFTLLEFLVTATIISFIGLVIYATFYQGLNVWKRAIQDHPETDIELFFEKLDLDVRNAFFFKAPGFIGRNDSLEFYTLGVVRPAAGAEALDGRQVPVRSKYFFQSAEGVLSKETADYYQLLYPRSDRTLETRVLATKVKGVVFQYFGRDKESAEYRWRTTWNRSCWPDAVKAQIFFKEHPGRTISKVIPFGKRICS